VALDKYVATQLVCNSVMTPAGRLYHSSCTREQFVDSLERSPLAFPVIVKPAFEGSSKGVRGPCLCADNGEAANRCLALSKDYQQPILVEEFIDGAEVTVGVIGNGELTAVIGAMRIVPIGASGPFIYSLEVKRDWRRRVRYEAPAALKVFESGILELAARNVYEALGCRDFARIDFRVRDGVPYFIEANPLPGLAPVTSDLVILAEGYGIDHSELIRRILHTALQRVGLMERAK
jgi:D-alanine-D-alanine ligase